MTPSDTCTQRRAPADPWSAAQATMAREIVMTDLLGRFRKHCRRAFAVRRPCGSTMRWPLLRVLCLIMNRDGPSGESLHIWTTADAAEAVATWLPAD
jgi:hypothetical protein